MRLIRLRKKICQRSLRVLCKVNQPFHELGSTALVSRTIVHIDCDCMRLELGVDHWPQGGTTTPIKARVKPTL